jgi:hypothetical protein
LEQVTETVVDCVTTEVSSDVAAFDPKSSVGTDAMVQDAVIVICTVMLVVAVPARADAGSAVKATAANSPNRKVNKGLARANAAKADSPGLVKA